MDGLNEAGRTVGDVVGVSEDVLAHHAVGGADVDPVPHLPVGQLVGLRHADPVCLVDELEPVRQPLQPGRLPWGDPSRQLSRGLLRLGVVGLASLDELVAAGRRSPRTVDLYRHVLARHLLPGLGSLRLSELTPARMDSFIRDRRRKAGYSVAKSCRSVASGVCGFAVRRDALRYNPVRDVEALESPQSREARALSDAECRAWLSLLDASPFAQQVDLPDLVRFLLGTGAASGKPWH